MCVARVWELALKDLLDALHLPTEWPVLCAPTVPQSTSFTRAQMATLFRPFRFPHFAAVHLYQRHFSLKPDTITVKSTTGRVPEYLSF